MKKRISSEGIRQQFLDFFVKKGHQLVPSHSLVSPDETVLLTTAGMQPFKACFLGEPCPYKSRVTSCQKCFRTSDIDEVGDSSHLTFFEMLGNFSFGDYSRKEAVHWALDLLINGYHLDLERIAVTFFGGDQNLMADTETQKIVLAEGISADNIVALGREDNFWGPVGKSGPCGPTMEIHYEISSQHGSPQSGEDLHQRFVEIWNLVFNQYFQNEAGELLELNQPGIDTGLGLERLVMILEQKSGVFETDLFADFMTLLAKESRSEVKLFSRSAKIVADHLRGIVFLVTDGIRPSNLDRGYILRRVIRRFIEHGEKLKLSPESWSSLINWIINKYAPIYPALRKQGKLVETIMNQERQRIQRASQRGWKALEKLGKRKLTGEDVLRLYTTYGLAPEDIEQEGYQFARRDFEKALRQHQNISRHGREKKFGGHGIINAEKEPAKVKLHTATHLLQAALREILGPEIHQQGSDINAERLRFDFSFSRALTKEEIHQVEAWVNQRIAEDLKVEKEEMGLEEAKQTALFLEGTKYPEKVSVYTIYDPHHQKVFSREICAGPHVSHLAELGRFRILQEHSSGAGLRRIRAVLE